MIIKVNFRKVMIYIMCCLNFDVTETTKQKTTTKDALIYILVYSNAKYNQTARLGQEKGQDYFIKNKCRFQNCFLTVNRSYFNDIREFDVILFNVITLKDWDLTHPTARSENQLYIFVSDEPQAIYPIPSHYNGFFNLTWTYKLNSDAFFRYIIIKNKRGEIIGPKVNMHWMDMNDMEPTGEEIKMKLQNKTKAGAWFVSNCETPNQREIYVTKLNQELLKYTLKIDLYGHCAGLKCSHDDRKCPKMIESEYYFYLAFENSMFEDYVTEKLLRAIENYAVPIVYGGANYSRYVKYLKDTID